MKKFFSLFLAAGLMFPAALVASAGESSGSSSSGSASSSGEAAVQNDSVILVARGTKIELSQELVGLLGSLTIENALQSGMQESRTREFELPEEFDVATAQTVVDILVEMAKTGSFDKSIERYVLRENVFPVLGLLDYLQADLLESCIMEFVLQHNLFAMNGPLPLLENEAARHEKIINAIFFRRVCVPNFRCERTINCGNKVLSVAWSPDGSRLASGQLDSDNPDNMMHGVVRIWNAKNGICEKELTGHTSAVWSVAWAPNGRTLASTSWLGKMRIYDVASGTCKIERAGRSRYSFAWSPDGESLASGATECIYDVASGTVKEQLLVDNTALIWLMAWSPDGKNLASENWNRIVQIWDAASGICRGKLDSRAYLVRSIAFSPDGKSLATGSDDGSVCIWDVATCTFKQKFTGHSYGVWLMAWSPNGKNLASASHDGTVRVWNVGNGLCKQKFTHLGSYYDDWMFGSIVWSPDSKYLTSCNDSIHTWDATSGVDVKKFTDHTSSVCAVTWSPNGKKLASCSFDKTLRIWGNEELDACTPLQKLFIMVNLKKGILQQIGDASEKLLSFIGWTTKLPDRPDCSVQWLAVYQSLPEQAKLLLDTETRAKYENFLLNARLAGIFVGESKVVKNLVPVQSAMMLALKQRHETSKDCADSRGSSNRVVITARDRKECLRELNALMLSERPWAEVDEFFDRNKKVFAGPNYEDLKLMVDKYVREHKADK